LHTVRIVFIFVLVTCFASSCGVYSFSGASIPNDVKSMSIEYISNRAPASWPSLDRIFNRELQNKMVQDAGMKLVESAGDYQLKGVINGYAITVQAPTAGTFSNTYKLTISVQVTFKNTKAVKQNEWTENFTAFEVYEGDISGKEDDLIQKISKNISNSIFNKIFSTW